MSEENQYLPCDTFETKISSGMVENVALRLNKFPAFHIEKNVLKFELYYKTKKSGRELISKANLSFKKSAENIMGFSAKYLYSLEKLPQMKICTVDIKPEGRMIVGLGSPSVYETSITLHHIYGFPYIPGQAIKGITRNFAINEYFFNEEDAMNDPEFAAIFGNTGSRGKVFFFDAYPTTIPIIDFDIMNVHYPKYYANRQEPTDDQNPNPITFLTVTKTSFAVSVGIKASLHPNAQFPKLKDKSIIDLIQFALENKGIGAKSSVGYGYLAKSDKRDRLFEKEYKKFVAQEEAELEKAKPLHIKLAETLSTNASEALDFLQSDEQSAADKAALSQAFIDFYSDSQAWNVKKINGQQFDFANQAHAFLQIYGTKVPDIVHYIKKYGGKNLKKKYK